MRRTKILSTPDSNIGRWEEFCSDKQQVQTSGIDKYLWTAWGKKLQQKCWSILNQRIAPNFQPLHLNGHYSVSYIFMKYFAFTSIQFGNENQEGWQCCQAPDFLCLIGLWGLRTHTSVFRHTSIKAERYSIAGQLWILYTFNFHLSPSRALNHDNKWAIRLSWLMASITISWRYPLANLYLLGESIHNLCNFKSILGTLDKFQMGGRGSFSIQKIMLQILDLSTRLFGHKICKQREN